MTPPDKPAIIRRPSRDTTCAVNVVPRVFDVHQVTANEIDDLASAAFDANVYLGVFFFCLGTAVAFGITLATVPLDERMLSIFTGIFWAAVILSPVLGFQFVRARMGARRKVQFLIRRPPLV